MTIPLVQWGIGADRISRGCDGRDHSDWYKTGLLNALIHFRPKVCLEIGTNKGGTTGVFERYFSLWREDGTLVTVDIEKFVDVSSKRVRQVLLQDFLSPTLLLQELKNEPVDFIFIDGDHSESGLLSDINLARHMKIPIVVLDDCRGAWPAPTKWFNEFQGEKYDFRDWPVYVGMGVVRI